MTGKLLWYLENIDVVGIFCPRKMQHADDLLRHREYARHEYIYFPDDDADKVYLVTKGKVKIGLVNEDGKEVINAILAEGEVFGEMAMTVPGRRTEFACTMEPTEVCILTVAEMRKMMRERSDFAEFVMRLLGSRLLRMENRLESLVFKDSRSRILQLLLEEVKTHGQPIGHEFIIRNFLTHKDIADLTATSRQTVSAVMNDLRKQNIIAFKRGQILIRDIDRLTDKYGGA